MNKYALAAVAGMAVTTGAHADAVFNFAGPVALGGGQSATLFSGNLSGMATGFNFDFLYGEPVDDGSNAADMQIEITAANGNSVTIGGIINAGDITPSYQGASGDAGTYGDMVDISSFNLGGSGLWTVTITNDFDLGGGLGDTNPNTVTNFNGLLIGSVAATGGAIVPMPSAMSLGLFGVTGLAATRRRR